MMDTEQTAIITGISVGSFILLLFTLCFYNYYCKSSQNIIIDPYSPNILILNNGLTAYQIQTIQDCCHICMEKFDNQELEILECNHIYHKKCFKIGMKCIKCQKGENQVPIQIIV